MLITGFRHQLLQRLIVAMLLFVLGLIPVSPAFAQQSVPAGPQTSTPNATDRDQAGGVVYQICAPPPVCFATQEARQDWARQNNCRFLEDVCDKTTPARDNKGATAADEGFWGGMWEGVRDGLVHGYEFVKGVLHGLKS